MISIAHNYLSCLVLNLNLFPCNSNLHFFPSIRFSSTSRIKIKIIPSPEIFDVLVNKHQFSPELASLSSSRLPQFRSPKRADSVLSFLKEYGFTTPQLQKIVIYNPQRILGFTIEALKFRFEVFHDLGLSPEEITKMMSNNQSILSASVANKIIPKLSLLKGLLGSNEEVATLLRKSALFLAYDLKKTLMPNVEILKRCGVSMECILRSLYIRPRFMLIKPYIMRKSVDRALEFGFSPTSVTFIYAAHLFSFTSERMWEAKLQTFRDLGVSNDEIFAMFRKHPMVFSASQKKMKNVIELLLATGKYNISCIVANPSSLKYSIKKRFEPRLQILGVLESRNLIEDWPALSTLAVISDDKFFYSFVWPYYDEIGKEFITKIYGKGKGRLSFK